MAVIIIGLVILVIGVVVSRNENPLQRLGGAIKIGGIVIMLIGIITASMVQIEAGQVGVKKLFGQVQSSTLSSGLHFINPLMQVIELDIKTQNYTMSGIQDERKSSSDDAIHVLTSDGLEVVIDLTVLYRLSPSEAPNLVKDIGIDYSDKIIRPISRTKIRDNAVYYQAIELFSTKRDEFQNRIFNSIESDFKSRGFLLEQLLVRNIMLPESVRTTIEQKINAEQEAQKMQFVLQKERQEAERKRVEAQGIADYQRIINQGLTDRQLQFEQIKAYKEMALSNNAKVIVIGNKGNTPIILDSKN